MFENVIRYLEANKDWIFSGIGVVVIFVYIIPFVYSRIKKKRLSVIQIGKEFDATIVEIDQDIKPELRDKLKVTYGDKPIDGIYELIFKIQNLGENPIKDITLLFCFESLCPVDFIDIELTNEERKAKYTITLSEFEPTSEIQVAEQEPDIETINVLKVLDQNEAFWELNYNYNPNVLALHLPYLNPWKDYEDYLGVTMVASKRLVIDTVVGKGVGWRTKYIDRTAYYRIFIKAMEKMAFLGAYAVGKIENLRR